MIGGRVDSLGVCRSRAAAIMHLNVGQLLADWPPPSPPLTPSSSFASTTQPARPPANNRAPQLVIITLPPRFARRPREISGASAALPDSPGQRVRSPIRSGAKLASRNVALPRRMAGQTFQYRARLQFAYAQSPTPPPLRPTVRRSTNQRPMRALPAAN